MGLVVAVAVGLLVPSVTVATAQTSGSEAKVPAAVAITGIDVASYQHPGGANINWGAVRAAGHSFAYIKATEGTTYTNPYFAGDWPGAGNTGLLRGAYHYARPRLPISSAVDQARYFVSRTGTMQGANDLPPMLDLEDTGSGLAPGDIVRWSRAWLGEVERLTGRRPMIYTGRWYWSGYLGSSLGLNDYRLWLSDYNGKAAPTATIPGWNWTIWQYTSSGSVPGIVGRVDMNRYCCTAANLRDLAGPGANHAAGNPFGSFDGVLRSTGTVRVQGWGIDPDTTAPVKVHVYANGQFQGEFTANGSRPDVGAAYPGFGSNHGFDISIPAGGDLTVCVYLINVAAGTANPRFDCVVSRGDPVGVIDAVRRVPDGLVVEGWAFDPDNLGPVSVHVSVDGTVRTATTDVVRPDVQGAFGLATAMVGYRVFVPASSGSRQVCLAAVDQPSGVAKHVTCRGVQVDSNPSGSLDVVSVGGAGLRVAGWAVDPDTAASTDVHIYDNGTLVASVPATGDRADIGAIMPEYGRAHGFEYLAPNVSNGVHTVCVYAMNLGAGNANIFLGCRSVVVSGSPFGALDIAATQGGQLRIAGWAIDHDAGVAPIAVRVTVDGVVTTVTANLHRGDVAAAFGLGPNHGFDVLIPLVGPLPASVRVEAIGVGNGPAISVLGDRTVA